jgi:small-conductance mechanosensitive channel/uncharacterized small protein (DUF1192 family)
MIAGFRARSMSGMPCMHRKLCLLTLANAAALCALAADDGPARAPDSRAVMTGEQVIQILDETVDWYRTLGIQQQAATQPSDLLILYANRQIADKVMALAFEIARANAELLASEAGEAQARAEESSEQSQTQVRRRLDAQRASLQSAIDLAKQAAASASGADRAELDARISVLQGELDLLNARRNMMSNVAQFTNQSDANGFGANTLKTHIDAIAASIPASAGGATAAAGQSNASEPAVTGGATTALSDFGIWDLAAAVFRRSAKRNTIEMIDRRTAELQDVFTKIRTPPLEQLKRLTTRGDELAEQSRSTDPSQLRAVRDQYDTLAWLYAQTSAMVTPLSKAEVLLSQYRRNLGHWREVAQRQYREALRALGERAALFGVLLAVVFVAAALWKRAVFRYVHDPRRRSRLLLLRKIVIWVLVAALAASAFATELGSLATFAGLITAGLAVAMQSVLVSFVGYFFLIGKYGIRVGDRVQVGAVTGEVIDLGLVRMHLMELSGDGTMSPTGRVVAFANSIVFQASGGLFKQIPGVDLAWREVTLTLPAGSDYTALKDRLAAAAKRVIDDYREDIVRQTRELEKTASSNTVSDPQPQVQLRFSASGVDAVVRYPVQLSHAAEIEERASRELLNVLADEQAGEAA